MVRKINWLLILFSLIGGVIGAVLGELMLSKWGYVMSDSLLMGLYFGILTLCVGIMCIFAEYINPELNGYTWKGKYLNISLKYLILTTFVFMFLAGTVLQFAYGLNIGGKHKKINDVVMVMDVSGSMAETDPNNDRFDAVSNLLSAMDTGTRAAILVFNDKIYNVQSMSEVTDNFREEVKNKLKEFEAPGSGTNIKDALGEAKKHIEETAEDNRAAMVILLSDGEDTYGLKEVFDETTQPYITSGIPVYSIGMNKGNFSLLKKLSRETGGNYYNISNVGKLKGIFNKIYMGRDRRLLIDNRFGVLENSKLYAFLRVFFLVIAGALIGLAIGLTFDNKYLARSFSVGGAVGGIIAGLILEIGFVILPWLGFSHRLFADLALAVIFTLFTAFIAVAPNGGYVEDRRGYMGGSLNSESFGKRNDDEKKRFY